MKNKILLLLFVLLSWKTIAQNAVNVTLQLVPPYSTRLSDYANNPGKAIIILQNTQRVAQTVYLRASISGDNGIQIFTNPNFRPVRGITLQPNIPYTLNIGDLQDLFDVNQLTARGITMDDIERKNGIPEGIYQVCVRAYDFVRQTTALSSDAPLGCTTIRLTQLEPPILIKPLEDEEVRVFQPQNMIFSWTVPAGSPVGTQYQLKIFEMIQPNRNPNDAFLSGTQPAFFEKTVTGNVYVLGPADPPLVVGRKYAWAVQALDQSSLNGRNQKGEGSSFRNNGRSEVRSFIYKNPEIQTVKTEVTTIPEKKPKASIPANFAVGKYVPIFANTVLSGTINYDFIHQSGNKNSSSGSGTSSSGAAKKSGNSQPAAAASYYPTGNGTYKNMTPANATALTNISTAYNPAFLSAILSVSERRKPLANIQVKLVVDYKMDGQLDGNKIQGNDKNYFSSMLKNYHEVIAVTKTDNNGNFKFTFVNTSPTKVLSADTSLTFGSGEFKNFFKGKITRSARIIVDSPYYTSPEDFLTYDEEKETSYKNLVAGVRDYELTVRLKNAEKILFGQKLQGDAVFKTTFNGYKVYLTRKNIPTEVPATEGDIPKPKKKIQGMEVIAEGVCNNNNEVVFKNLVVNLESGSNYYIITEKPDNKEVKAINNFTSGPAVYFALNKDYKDPDVSQNGQSIIIGGPGLDNATFNSEYETFTNIKCNVNMFPLYPRIEGFVYRSDNKKVPVTNGDVKFFYGDIAKLGLSLIFDATAKFKIPLDTKGHFDTGSGNLLMGPLTSDGNFAEPYSSFAYRLNASGFKPAGELIYEDKGKVRALAPGFYKYYDGIFLSPSGRVKGSVVDEDGNGISVVITPGTGAKDSTFNVKTTYKTSSVKSGSGKFGTVYVLSENTPPVKFDLPATSGKIKFHIDVKDESFFDFDSTFSIGDNSVVDLGKLVMKKKQHRIKVIVMEDKSPVPSPANNFKKTAADVSKFYASSGPKVVDSGNKLYTAFEKQEAEPNASQVLSTVLKYASEITYVKDASVEIRAGEGSGGGSPLSAKYSPVKAGSLSGNKNQPSQEDEGVAIAGLAPQKTDAKGTTGFNFSTESGANNFVIKVNHPDYAIKNTTVVNFPSKEEKAVIIMVQKSAKISGKVFGTDSGSPLAKAKVYVKEKPEVKAETKSDGTYELHGLQRGVPLTVIAEKSGSNYLGGSKSLTIMELSQNNVDFGLKKNDTLDVTKILGLPVTLTEIRNEGGKIKVTGSFNSIPSNPNFIYDSTKVLTFKDLEVTKSAEKNSAGLPYLKPVAGKVVTQTNKLVFQTYKKFSTIAENTSAGIVVSDGGGGKGQIKEKAYILTSAAFPDTKVDFTENRFYLTDLTVADKGQRVQMAIFAANTLPNRKIGIADASGNALKFKLFSTNLEAEADAEKSYINADSVRLFTVIHTNLKNISPADLKISMGYLNLLYGKGLNTMQSTSSLTMSLEKWQLVADKYVIGNEGFILKSGKIKTGLLDVPFKDIKVTTEELLYGTYEVNELSLGGVIKIQPEAGVQFGYDSGKSHWSLKMDAKPGKSIVASFGGLPNLNPEDRFYFSNMSLYSDGSKGYDLASDQKDVTAFKLFRFKPKDIQVTDGSVNIPGFIDLNIPNLESKQTLLQFTKQGTNISTKVLPFDYEFKTNTLTVRVKAADNKITETGHFATGSVSEDGKFSFPMSLGKNKDTCGISLPKSATFNLASNGNSKLINMAGGLRVNSGNWSLLKFGGDIMGANGATGRLNLEVHGDIVADNQKVGVKNIDTPYGNIGIIYNFDKGQLEGHLHTEKDMGSGTFMKADINMVMGNEGWYFLGAGEFEKTNPVTKGMAATIIGMYPMTEEIRNIFKQYSWVYQLRGELPPIFPNQVKGFYIEGKAEIPVPIIPQFDIDLGVVSGKLSATIGADMRVSMNFSDGLTLGIGQSVFANVTAGVGGSIGIACGGLEASVTADVSVDGQISTSGNWFVDGSAMLILKGSAYWGWGVCDSDCDGTFCDSSSDSITKTLGIRVHMGSDAKKYELYIP